MIGKVESRARHRGPKYFRKSITNAGGLAIEPVYLALAKKLSFSALGPHCDWELSASQYIHLSQQFRRERCATYHGNPMVHHGRENVLHVVGEYVLAACH